MIGSALGLVAVFVAGVVVGMMRAGWMQARAKAYKGI
jgi:uncharacterized membrane protein YedE/YeeE